MATTDPIEEIARKVHMAICAEVKISERIATITYFIREAMAAPIPMILWRPMCGIRHIDNGEFATKVHHTHACQHCGHIWRPAIVPTVGVRFLPGFKDGEE